MTPGAGDRGIPTPVPPSVVGGLSPLTPLFALIETLMLTARAEGHAGEQVTQGCGRSRDYSEACMATCAARERLQEGIVTALHRARAQMSFPMFPDDIDPDYEQARADHDVDADVEYIRECRDDDRRDALLREAGDFGSAETEWGQP